MSEAKGYELELIPPFSTFTLGTQPVPIRYIQDGLLVAGGFSVLSAKAKQGKSSVSRHLAVCVAKGEPFLSRTTEQGEVVLISLEDPLNHVDNALLTLGYDKTHDAPIHIINKLPTTLSETIDALGNKLSKMPDVRLVIADTLAKTIRVKDFDDYAQTLTAVEQIHNLARQFPHLHIQALAHMKKVKTDDPFDGILGSTALRGEPDTSIALYQESGHRIIDTEVRVGHRIPPTILHADIVSSAGADIVTNFHLGRSLAEVQAERTSKIAHKKDISFEERIIDFLRQSNGVTAQQERILDEVVGKREQLFDAISRLAERGVIVPEGVKGSKTNPTSWRLVSESLRMNGFMNRFGATNEYNN